MYDYADSIGKASLVLALMPWHPLFHSEYKINQMDASEPCLHSLFAYRGSNTASPMTTRPNPL